MSNEEQKGANPEEQKAPETEKPAGDAKAGEAKPRLARNRPHYHQKSKKGLFIAMGAGAAVIAAVLVVMASGGGMSADDVKQGRDCLRGVVAACLDDKPDAGIALMNCREVLRVDKPEEVKLWDTLGEKKINELKALAFSSVREKVVQQGFADAAAADAALAKASHEINNPQMRIEFTWKVNDDNWSGTVTKITGQWQFVRIRKLNR